MSPRRPASEGSRLPLGWLLAALVVGLGLVFWVRGLVGADEPQLPVGRTPPPLSSRSSDSPREGSSALEGPRSATATEGPVSPRPTPPPLAPTRPPLVLRPVAEGERAALLRENAERAARHVEDFCEAVQKRPRLPWDDAPRRGGRDASFFLGDKVDWDAQPPHLGSLHLAPALASRLAEAGARWPDWLGESDLYGVDLAWLGTLRGYDTWSLAESPLDELSGAAEALVIVAPVYGQFLDWAKLRFVRALGPQADLPAAVSEVRHLAGLLRSHGLPAGDEAALALLEIERQAFEAAQRQGRDVSGWAPVGAAGLASARELDQAAPGFFYPGVDPAVMERAGECASRLCGALHEAASVETALGHPRTAFWSLAERRSCDRALLRKFKGVPLPGADRLVGAQALRHVFGP